jgi:hypothetical protein
MKLNKVILLLMALALLVGSTGCIFKPEENQGPGGGQTERPAATTAEQLLTNFSDIYEEMHIEDFRDMLHPDYRTVLLPSTLEEWQAGGNPLAEAVFYRDDEIRIHENMFGGLTGTKPNNEPVDAIESIVVDYLDKAGPWLQVPETHEHFAGYGAYYALYNVLIYFVNPDQHQFKVQQDVEFYVVPVTEGGREIWKLLGQVGHEPSYDD